MFILKNMITLFIKNEFEPLFPYNFPEKFAGKMYGKLSEERMYLLYFLPQKRHRTEALSELVHSSNTFAEYSSLFWPSSSSLQMYTHDFFLCVLLRQVRNTVLREYGMYPVISYDLSLLFFFTLYDHTKLTLVIPLNLT